MRRRLLAPTMGLVLTTLGGAASAPRALAQEPPRALAQEPVMPSAPAGGITAEAPIIAGNAASAKQRALAEAFRTAVTARLDLLLAEAGMAQTPSSSVQRLRDSLASRAGRFVRRHRVLSEQEQNGVLRLQVEAEVDDSLLGREIERLRGAAVPRALATRVLVIGGGPADALAQAFALAGVPAEVVAGVPLDEARVREAMTRRSAGAAALVTSSASEEGGVRGTSQKAVRCRVAGRLIRGTGQVESERAAEERAFGDSDETARDACFGRAAASVGRELSAALMEAGQVASRVVMLELDLVEPAALPPVLQALRRVASVSSSEVRQVTLGRVQIRVLTRLTGMALGQALAREIGPTVTATIVDSAGDRVVVRARMASVPAALPAPDPAPPAGGVSP